MTADGKVGAPDTAPGQLSTGNLVIQTIQHGRDPQPEVICLIGWPLRNTGSHNRPRHLDAAGTTVMPRLEAADSPVSAYRTTESNRGSR